MGEINARTVSLESLCANTLIDKQAEGCLRRQIRVHDMHV